MRNKILQLNDEGNKGYLFDVNINYSDELHDLHNGYSLALENMIIKNEMLNDYQKEKRKETKISKLITNFYDKKNYGVNYRLLKLYLKLGLRITNECFKIHSRRLYEKLYFTEERTKAKNDFEKDFYKLMNNSVYGKTMENVRNRITFKIVSSKAIILRNVIKKRTIFNENCVGVHLLKKEIKLNKPIFIGQIALDESKYLMYDFHYNFMLKQIDRKILIYYSLIQIRYVIILKM